MYVDAQIATGADKPVIAVPTGAVIDSGTRQVVILDKGEGQFEPREVKPGRRGEGYVEIRDGGGEGARVVVAANFLIAADSNLGRSRVVEGKGVAVRVEPGGGRVK